MNAFKKSSIYFTFKKVLFYHYEFYLLIIEKLEVRNVIKFKKMFECFILRLSLNILSF